MNKLLVFQVIYIFSTTTFKLAQCEAKYLTELGGKRFLTLKMDVNFIDASELCHDVLGGRFPVIYDEQDIKDLSSIGLDNFFLEVNATNNKGKIQPLSEQRTYKWSSNSFFEFHPWAKNYPNCTEDCCIVLYAARKMYDGSCKSQLANMVCILPDFKIINNEEWKELIQSIIDSSSEEEVRTILQINYRKFKNIDEFIKPWMGKEVYFNPTLELPVNEVRSKCSSMGGELPYVTTQQEKDSLRTLLKETLLRRNKRNEISIFTCGHGTDLEATLNSPNYHCNISCFFTSQKITIDASCPNLSNFICIVPGTVSLSAKVNQIKIIKILTSLTEIETKGELLRTNCSHLKVAIIFISIILTSMVIFGFVYIHKNWTKRINKHRSTFNVVFKGTEDKSPTIITSSDKSLLSEILTSANLSF